MGEPTRRELKKPKEDKHLWTTNGNPRYPLLTGTVKATLVLPRGKMPGDFGKEQNVNS